MVVVAYWMMGVVFCMYIEMESNKSERERNKKIYERQRMAKVY